MKALNNKWIRAAIPALLLHCSIGTVYCWSTFKEAIADKIGMSTFAVGWAFSIAIFFLGMSAAFAGRLVEKNIHKSSLIACICFSLGMIGTGLFIQFTTGIIALIGIFLCYGCIMGIGLGIGYLTPVKTLMLWFPKQKGLATGISIMGFGLAKAIATPIMEVLQKNVGISKMFYILGAVYFVMMFIGHLLLKKPEGWVEADTDKEEFKPLQMFKNKTFLGIWLMFFINIHCGLALITYEKQILKVAFAGTAILGTMISIIPSVTAAFNALGRIGYSTISDKMKERNTVYKIIFLSCIIVTIIALATFAISNGANSIIFGIITTVVNFTVYFSLQNFACLSATVSNIIAWIASVIVAFVTNKIFVFKSNDWSWKATVSESLRFFGSRVMTGVLETAGIYITVDFLHLDGNIMKWLIGILVVLCNYLTGKIFVFRK